MKLKIAVLWSMAIAFSLMFQAGSVWAAGGFEQPFTYQTSSIAGTNGYVEFVYNAPGTTGISSSYVSGFTGGTLGSDIQRSGRVYGDLSDLLIEVATPTVTTSSYRQQITYGDSLSFVLSLCGCANSVTSFGMYDASGAPLLTTDPTGPILKVTTNDGQFTVVSTPLATPVPGAVWLLGSGLAALVGIRRKMEA